MILQNITAPIFYVTNDVAKGLGLEEFLPNYHIVCIDSHPIVDCLNKAEVNVFCLERKLEKKNIIFRSSGKLLEHPLVEKYIKDKAGKKIPWILYFKPSPQIDLICQKRGYKKIGNESWLNRLFEDKISFRQFCQEWQLPIPIGESINLKEASFDNLREKYGNKLVVQFGRGWAGSTTYFIASRKEFDELKQERGNRKAKISKFIEGKTLLNNCCVTKDRILVGPPAEQITSDPGFTSKEGGTCGRAWPARIDRKRYRDIEILSGKIGEEMRKRGYLGYFGLDFLIERSSGKVYISENNARLTASVPFYTKLEIQGGRMPLLAYHILGFLEEKRGEIAKWSGGQIAEYEGSEVIVRNDSKESVLVKKDFRPGIYGIKTGRLELVRKAYDVKGIKAKGEFFLTAASKGRIVNPEMELARLNTLTSALNGKGRLEKWAVKMLMEVKNGLFNGH